MRATESILLDFAASFAADTVVAGPEVNTAHANAALRLQVLAGGRPRNLILKAPAGRWDVPDHLYLAVALRNTGPRLRLATSNGPLRSKLCQYGIYVAPDASLSRCSFPILPPARALHAPRSGPASCSAHAVSARVIFTLE